MTLYIDLAIAAHFVYQLKKITLWLIVEILINLGQMKILEKLFVFLDREDDCGLVSVSVDDVLNVCHGRILT